VPIIRKDNGHFYFCKSMLRLAQYIRLGAPFEDVYHGATDSTESRGVFRTRFYAVTLLIFG